MAISFRQRLALVLGAKQNQRIESAKFWEIGYCALAKRPKTAQATKPKFHNANSHQIAIAAQSIREGRNTARQDNLALLTIRTKLDSQGHTYS